MAHSARAPRRGMVVGACAAIAIVAVMLRAVGLFYGLPAVYNPDEVAIMARALRFAHGDLNPHNFLYPTLYFYVLFAWEGCWFLIGRAVGVFPSLSAFERSFFVDPSSIYAAGRLLSLVCGVVTVWATGTLAARLFGRTAGITAALFLAVAPLAVRDAHYVKHDVPVTLLIVLTCLALARLEGQERQDGPDRPDRPDGPASTGLRAPVRPGPAATRGWLISGAAAGLAMSTHYYAVFLIATIAVALLLARRSGRYTHRDALAAFGACALAFAATSPFLLLEPATALHDIAANRGIVIDRVTQTRGALGSLGFYGGWLSRDAAGVIAAVLSLAGALVVLRTDWRRLVWLLAFPLTFLLLIANTFPASRYLNPVLPFIAILAGTAVAWVARRGPVGAVVAVLLSVAVVAEAGTASFETDRFFRKQDTRTLAQIWIEQTLPPEASILVQPYSVPLRPSRAALVEALTAHLGNVQNAGIKFARQLDLNPYPVPAYRTLYFGTGGLDDDKIYITPAEVEAARSLAPLRARAVAYVILKRYNVADSSVASLSSALEREGRLLATFSPYRAGVDTGHSTVAPFLHNTDVRIDSALERPGPMIQIWKID